MTARVGAAIYARARGTPLPIRERSASRASGVMVGNRAGDMRQLWSGLGRGSRHDIARATLSTGTDVHKAERSGLRRAGGRRLRRLFRSPFGGREPDFTMPTWCVAPPSS